MSVFLVKYSKLKILSFIHVVADLEQHEDEKIISEKWVNYSFKTNIS